MSVLPARESDPEWKHKEWKFMKGFGLIGTPEEIQAALKESCRFQMNGCGMKLYDAIGMTIDCAYIVAREGMRNTYWCKVTNSSGVEFWLNVLQCCRSAKGVTTK